RDRTPGTGTPCRRPGDGCRTRRSRPTAAGPTVDADPATGGTRAAPDGSSSASGSEPLGDEPRHERREGRTDLGGIVLAGTLERVAGAVDVDEGRAVPQSLDDGRKPRRVRERIPRPVEEEHRDRKAVQVLVSDPLGLARRVERIAEEDEGGGRHALGGGHRGDPAAVALAAA